MVAVDKKSALAHVWNPLRCLIIEEISMISPHLYNMLQYLSHLARAERWEVEEQDYD